MRTTRRLRASIFCALLAELSAALSACTRQTETSAQELHQALGAEAAMDAYLRFASVTDTNPMPDSLQACEAYGGGDPQLALAKFNVVGSVLARDTAIVHVEITSVATVRLAADGPYEVRQGVRLDTLSWRLVKGPVSRRWAVCGYSREGVGFVRLQFLGPAARWLDGATLNSVMALVDSLDR